MTSRRRNAPGRRIAAAEIRANNMLTLLLWILLLLVCWPLALLALVLYPFVWLILLPFRILGFAVGGVLQLVAALFSLPARILRAL